MSSQSDSAEESGDDFDRLPSPRKSRGPVAQPKPTRSFQKLIDREKSLQSIIQVVRGGKTPPFVTQATTASAPAPTREEKEVQTSTPSASTPYLAHLISIFLIN